MFTFVFREAFRSMGNAKYSTFFALMSVVIGVVLVYISLTTIAISKKMEKSIKENFFISVYLSDEFGISKTDSLINVIKNRDDAVLAIKYISKVEAEKEFIKETGEDFRNILEYNPLPASLVIYLHENKANRLKIDSMLAYYKTIEKVEGAEYKAGIFERASQILASSRVYVISLSLVLFFIAFYVVYSTLRLIIIARGEEIETMKLVGASSIMIKLPIYINGFFIGLIGNVIAMGVYYGVYQIWLQVYQQGIIFDQNFVQYLIPALFIGPVAGIMCSMFAGIKIFRQI